MEEIKLRRKRAQAGAASYKRTTYVNRNKDEPRGVVRQGLKRSASARRKKVKRGK